MQESSNSSDLAEHSDLVAQGDLVEPGDLAGHSDLAAHGVVKWYSLAKGYGFIEHGASGEDLFVHHSAVERPEDLMAGDQVSFEVVKGPQGPQAAVVRRVD